MLCRAILGECHAHRFGGVLADFEGGAREDRLPFLSRLGAMLAQSGRRLYVPERFAVPEASVLICTALSGGTLRERLTTPPLRHAAHRTRLSAPCDGLRSPPAAAARERRSTGGAVRTAGALRRGGLFLRGAVRELFQLHRAGPGAFCSLRHRRNAAMQAPAWARARHGDRLSHVSEVSDLLPELLNA